MSPDEYVIRVTGKKVLANYEFECPKCKTREERSIDHRELPDNWDVKTDHEEKCESCGTRLVNVFMSRAPTVFIGGDKSDRRIALMRKSFRERFTKGPEIDEVRHKKGVLYDDSIRSAAAQKIKKETEPEGTV